MLGGVELSFSGLAVIRSVRWAALRGAGYAWVVLRVESVLPAACLPKCAYNVIPAPLAFFLAMDFS